MPRVSLPLLALLLVPLASTPPEPVDVSAPQVNYEELLVQWGLAQYERELDPSPEGKPLEAVLVAQEYVVAESDPYPGFLNSLHVRSREEVVRREVLLTPGQPYSAALAEETSRNLRDLDIFAVVRAVAVRGETPGSVALLVVTKDVWSLRLNNDFSAVGSLLQYLRLSATEDNFLGRGKKVALDFSLTLDTYSVGQSYIDKQLLGSRWTLNESAAVILGRESGRAEGTRGNIALSRPLYSLATQWSVASQVTWNMETSRTFRGADVWQLPYPDGEPVPYVYNAREVTGSVLYLRSWGDVLKWEAGGGAGAYHKAYSPPVESRLDAGQSAWFQSQFLPRSEDALYATGVLRLYRSQFEVLRDVDTYSLSEDFQVGPSLTATVRYAPPVLASGTHFAETGVAARYRARLGDALMTASVAGTVRRQFGEGAGWTNRRWATELHGVSPKLLGGRFVVRGLLDVNVDDVNERVVLLGGGNGLRGAPVDAYAGRRLLLFNAEYRTPPLIIRTLHVGGVLFYDSGSAFERRPKMVSSVGVGLRLLLPQFNIIPFRLDFGCVLDGERPPVGSRFLAAGGQITDNRPSFLDTPLR
ncbi:BamA/TamA family outer membrane protein [Pyxidicoccus parkwayensis]|uniref:BamA/TamA family outer membrane protein n=1 Tax=Pyxidicoccus parkwayensis TaxID=2813578 RepID=A0ABX7P5D5_9BACT|nr:BamA/TamA family outer membrane protein [Pyxidicoccus parkwaysis]QSQ25635.1 BamA/TamA family outer membrane protein [Pyxidicoccus parkwaysis]